MKIRILKNTLFILLLVVFSCKNYDKDINLIKDKVESIDEKLTDSPSDKFLKFLEFSNIEKSYNSEFEKHFENKSIYFNLNLKNQKPQVIHISSDSEKIPFMVLCKIKGKDVDEKFTIDSLQLAIRSIGRMPHTFFKITGKPTLTKITDSVYDWKLQADIDLNLPSRSSDQDGHVDCSNIKFPIISKQLIDVEINPKKLIASLEKLSKDNPLFEEQLGGMNIEDLINILCCQGVICHTEPTVPKP